jgi:hypothetical protein
MAAITVVDRVMTSSAPVIIPLVPRIDREVAHENVNSVRSTASLHGRF